MNIAIITPTIGTEYLDKCIQSVQQQYYDNITHYIFVDGQEHLEKVTSSIRRSDSFKKVSKIVLDENIGKGWYGHRVYAASSFLVNSDVLCYLDEDNWIEPHHISSLVDVLKDNVDWAYSLRKIYSREGKYICKDNCESLGKYPIYSGDDQYHIDTSCFAVRREVALMIGHSWYGQWGADRQFFHTLKRYFSKYECSGEYSLCYRLDGNPDSVKKEFFLKGNAINFKKYNKNFPWEKRSDNDNIYQ